MAALAESSEERYLDRLASLVSELAPATESAAAIRERCRELVRRARARGISTEFEVAAFVACGFAGGMDFDTRAGLPYRRILESPGVPPRVMARMLAFVLENAEHEEPDQREA
jgi:hypothetical protein